jgi:hypothetical protein
MRIAIYARVSTDDKGQDPENQLRQLRQWCTDAGLAEPKMKARLADLGGTVLPGPPSDFGKLIVEETEKWAKVVKFAGIKAD